MTNERLREALYDSDLTLRQVAEAVEVDPKTVERWIALGRTPYPRHRRRVARLLDLDEAELWPDAGKVDRRRATAGAEVIQVYPHRSSVPSELWCQLLEREAKRIDVLVYSGLFLPEQNPHLLTLLRRKAECGTRVRLLMGDPDCAAVIQRGQEEGVGDVLAAKVRNSLLSYELLAGHQGIEVRLHRTTLYASIYHFDDDMLVNTHIYGLAAAHAPVLHLQRTTESELFELYYMSFERVWQNAIPAWMTDV